MKLYFLADASGIPLTKRITATETTAYPKTSMFNSFEFDVNTIEEFHEVLEANAEHGHCLLKGQLHRPLANERRRNSTKTEDATQWICLDIDGVDTPNIEAAINELPAVFHNTSYVAQYSASHGFKAGMRAHVFMILNRNIPAPMLKNLLIQTNLDCPAFEQTLELADDGHNLKWPLDITVCQNDKLIFISPPILQGVADPIEDRIELVLKGKPQLTLPNNFAPPGPLHQRKQDKLDELRDAEGLPKRKTQWKERGDRTYIANPMAASVTGVRQEGEYVRLDINGKDSWRLYHYTDDPSMVFDFKTDCWYMTKDYLPDYWKQVRANERAERAILDIQPLVFRDFLTDGYWNGVYNPAKNQLRMARTGGKDKMSDFMAQYGMPLPDPIEDWNYTFDPTTTEVINFEQRFANQFVPTKYLLNPEPALDCPPIIKKILLSVTGSDPECYEHMINWLAHVYQTRTKPMTAWILHGVEGTGKGLLFHNVLSPTLGHDHCVILTVQDFNDQFNDWLERCLILFVDEVKVDATERKTLNRINNLITEPQGRIRSMKTNPYQVNLYNSLIFSSNEEQIMYVSESDRRMNVAVRQERKLIISTEEVLAIEAELPQFVGYMMQVEVDRNKVINPIDNAAKHRLRAANQNSTDQFFESVRSGHIDPLLEIAVGNPPMHKQGDFEACRKVLAEWVDASLREEPHAVNREEIYAVYKYLQSNKETAPAVFTRLLAHNGIHPSKTDGHKAYWLRFFTSKTSAAMFQSNGKVVSMKRK